MPTSARRRRRSGCACRGPCRPSTCPRARRGPSAPAQCARRAASQALAGVCRATAPWAACGSSAARGSCAAGPSVGGQTWLGTERPAQWYPQSRTQPASSARDVASGSKVTDAVWFTALASTAWTPGRRSRAVSTALSLVAQCRPPTCRTAVWLMAPSLRRRNPSPTPTIYPPWVFHRPWEIVRCGTRGSSSCPPRRGRCCGSGSPTGRGCRPGGRRRGSAWAGR